MASVAGCMRGLSMGDADTEVYGIVSQVQRRELGGERPFTIDGGPSRNIALTAEEIAGALPEAPPLPEWLAEGELGRTTRVLREIDIVAALRLARRNSREFQGRKESLYETALSLTAEEHAFEFQYGAGAGGDYTIENADRDHSWGSNADFGITRQLVSGAVLALDIGLTGVKYLNHELGTSLQSALALSITQPLWRGSSRTVVLNGLIQARRNMVYALRTFARYEKQFAVEVASRYYGVLLDMDRVKNQWENYKNLMAARERNEWLAEAGQLRILELDQARQSELAAHNQYLTAVQQLERQLDAFRVLIGLPADTPIVLSQRDLRHLTATGIATVGTDPVAAIGVALVQRLDLKNTRGAVEDADRAVFVAADDMKGDVDLFATAGVDSTPATHAGRFLFHQGTYQFGLDIDLPLERLDERNALRRALIAHQASVRDYMAAVDGIKLDVRESLRELKRTGQTYKIAEVSVALARKRVEGTSLELEAGRATTRDLLESQDALVTAQNSRTDALVSHLVTRLEFQRDLELLEVDSEGQIHEIDIESVMEADDADDATTP
jgi:outer membrane protein TolC